MHEVMYNYAEYKIAYLKQWIAGGDFDRGLLPSKITFFESAACKIIIVTNDPKIIIESTTSAPEQEFLDNVERVRLFISFAIDMEIELTEAKYYGQGIERQIVFPNIAEKFLGEITTYYRLIDIHERIDIFKNWNKHFEDIQNLVALYLISKTTKYGEHAFLFMVQVVEGTYKRFKIGDQKDLWPILREMYEVHIKQLIGERYDANICGRRFIRSIKDDRDYYSHMGIGNGKLSNRELLEARLLLNTIFECCVLKRVGFEYSKIELKVKNKWDTLAQLNGYFNN